MSEFVTVTELSRIPQGQGLLVRLGQSEIALFHIDGAVHALDNQCPHRGGPLALGVVQDGCVFCPLHGWAFEIRSGTCVERPDKPVRSYPVRVCGDQVQVKIDGGL